MEIGGTYFPRNSSKSGVLAGDDVAVIVRPNSIGHALFMSGQQPYRQPSANLGVNLGVFALSALGLVLLSSWLR